MLTIIAITLGVIIIVTECLRVRNHPVLDFLSFTSVVYFIVFVASPILIDFSTRHDLARTSLSWVMVNSLGREALVYAELLALTSYLVMAFSYCNVGPLVATMFGSAAGKPPESTGSPTRQYSRKSLLLAGSLLGVVGSMALYVYAGEIGGFYNLFKYAGALRSGDSPIETQYAFLKNVSSLVLASSLVFYALWRDFRGGVQGRVHGLLFVVSLIFSFIVLFHMAGRLRFFSYLMIFPTVAMMIKGRVKTSTVIFGIALSLLVILFGKQVSHILIDPETISRKVSLIESENYSIASSIATEFAFPLATIANTICYAVPNEIPYRYFVDFLLAVVYLVPKRIFPIELPATANNLNGEQFGGPIPIDLISLGYYSAGVFGTMAVMLGFGVCLRIAESIFAAREETIISVFRVAWMFFLGFRIMYGDPVNSLKVGFYLVVGSVLLLLVRRRRSPGPEAHLIPVT